MDVFRRTDANQERNEDSVNPKSGPDHHGLDAQFSANTEQTCQLENRNREPENEAEFKEGVRYEK